MKELAERVGFDANGPRFPRENYRIPPALMSMAFCAISEFRQDFLEDLPSPFLQLALGRLRKESANPKGLQEPIPIKLPPVYVSHKEKSPFSQRHMDRGIGPLT